MAEAVLVKHKQSKSKHGTKTKGKTSLTKVSTTSASSHLHESDEALKSGNDNANSQLQQLEVSMASSADFSEAQNLIVEDNAVNAGEKRNDSVAQKVAGEGFVGIELENGGVAISCCEESAEVLGIVNENAINDDIVNTLLQTSINFQTVPVVDSSTKFTDSSVDVELDRVTNSALSVDDVINAVSTSAAEAVTSSGDIDIRVERAEAAKSVDQVSTSDKMKAPALTLGDILVESFASSLVSQQIPSTEASIGRQADLEHLPGAHATKLSAHENLPASIAREKASHRPIYPVLVTVAESPKENVLKAFTIEQLRSLYYNFELEHVNEFIDTFLQVQTSDVERHEFYELVLNYYRARHQLLGAELDIELLKQEVKASTEQCWSTVEEKLVLQGTCLDKSKVSGEVNYERAVFNQESCQRVVRTLKNIRDVIHNEFVLHAYEVQLSRLQVESYIYSLYSNNPALRDVPVNAPVQALLAHHRDANVTHQVEMLRQCISVLFLFQRKPVKDNTFISDSRQWLSKMMATLLRLATLEDHLFILSHVLRCPAGIAKWACSFIQPVALPSCTVSHSTGWGSLLLDHFITMIYLILQPVRHREEMLCQLKVTLSPSAFEKPNDSPWILVDSDGEEDEDPSNSWCYLQENDYVTLLNQFPLAVIFQHILLTVDDQGAVLYDARYTSETAMLKLFAFISCLIRIFGQGLRTFKLGRYRQLNKRIGRLIRHTVQYTCDHWANFLSAAAGLPEATITRLQLESDMILLRAVACIVSAHRLGSWQFLAELPYETASCHAVWRLLWLMHKGCCLLASDLDDRHIADLIPADASIEQCRRLLNDEGNRQDFLDKLTIMPTSEAIFLLTTFANMACTRPSTELDFIETVTGEIFEIAYVCSHTRELCSKPGRDILQSVCTKHPLIMSFLLQKTVESLGKIGLVSHFLYRGLPVHLWQPSDVDIGILRRWLIDSGVQSVENVLARLIISRLNWNIDTHSNLLFLKVSIHRQMAVLLMDAMIAHLSGKQLGKLFVDGQKQVVGKTTSSDENTELAQWIWSIALHLKLHVRSRPRNDDADDTTLHESIALGLVEEHRFTLALYLVIVTTACGLRDAEFCTDGIRYLALMVEKSYFVPVVQCLFYVVPMFYQCPSYLTSSTVFMQSLLTTLQADWSRKSYFSYDSPRCIANLFSSMIQTQVDAAAEESVSSRVVIEFWLTVLTKLPNWHKEKDVLFIMDNIVKASFHHDRSFQSVMNIFADIAKTTARDRGSWTLSSVMSWLGVSSSSDRSSPLVESCASDTAWLAYVSLAAESELSSELWTELGAELSGSPISTTVEQALSKVTLRLKLETSSAANLPIYRWANQALETPVDHPLLPLLWQRFMLLYLGRSAAGQRLPQRGSVGDRFFTSGWQLSLMKRMKKRLTDTADHYRQLATRCPTGTSGEPDDQPATSISTRDFCEKLEKLFRTMSFWLDEPRLHDPNLYVLALPPNYQAQLLITVFQNQTDLWLDFIDMPGLSSDLKSLARHWDQRGAPPTMESPNNSVSPDSHQRRRQSQNDVLNVPAASVRLLSRLEHNSTPVLAPPNVTAVRPTVPEITSELLCDQHSLLFALHSDYITLVEHARVYGERVSKHVDLDCYYAELIPKLCVNVPTEGVVYLPCRSFNPTHHCKGPANVPYRYDCKKTDELVNRKIEENRSSYGQLLIESTLTPPQNMCGSAVHVENAVTRLINLCKSSSCSKTRLKASEVGIALFYSTLTYVSEETKYYPPTRQFFSYCIEILGQEFIRCNPVQSQPLLQAILQTPSLTGLLAPNFNPNGSPPELFVPMYEDMVQVPSVQGVEVAFTLLTKFDIAQWLHASKPVLSQRTQLIEYISNALCLCGKEPQSSMIQIMQIYRFHLQQILKYQFPDHFGLILKMLIKGCASNKMCVEIWQDFLAVIGAIGEIQSPVEAVSESAGSMPCSLRKESLEYLSTYFIRLRVSSEETSTFGLYPTWAAYAPSLARLLGFLAVGIIKETAAPMRHGSSVDPEHVVSELFKLVTEAYAPWIQPLDNNGKMLLPWILNEDTVATDMVSEWLSSVECLHFSFKACLPTYSRQALSLLWDHYVTLLASKPGVVDHILAVYHTRLVTLPWSDFYPDMYAIELMVKVATDCRRICFECLGNIFTILPWRSIMQFYCTQEPSEIVSRLHVCLFTLLVRLGSEKVIIENTSLPQLLWSQDIFVWDYVDAVSYSGVIQWFVDTCRPSCITASHSTGVTQVLTLLKMVAGFYPRTDLVGADIGLHSKRCSYVHCIVQLVCRCSTERDIKSETLTVVINNLISELESVVGSIADVSQQFVEATALCIELLNVLNNCGPAHSDMSLAFVGTILKWIESSPTSILLMPMINSACQSLASTAHMVQVVEACIDAYFTLDVNQPPDFGWSKLVAAVCVPELSFQQFVRDAIHYGCYLSLYVYVLQHLPRSKSLDDELEVLNQLLQWTNSAQPSLTNETKLLLWWHKMLELCLRQIDFGAEQRRVVKVLLSLIPRLVLHGEDKSSSGLFGAIGLGRKSVLSLRFRLVAKIMSAFLAAQMPSDASLRLEPDAPGSMMKIPPSNPKTVSPCSPSQQARQAYAVLESLRTNKQYAAFRQTIDVAIDGISSQPLSFRDSTIFFSQLISGLFPEITFLEILRLRSV